MSELNCLSYWFPLLWEAGLPVPRTRIVKTTSDLDTLLDGVTPPGYPEFLGKLGAACAQIGYPVFLRTGHVSGKHNWKHCCYVREKTYLRHHITALVEWSSIVDIMGLPTNVWAAREMLPTEPLGVLPLYGDMPACREFRCFVRRGTLKCLHPYWPLEALLQGGGTERMYERLADISPEETQSCIELAEAAGRVVEGEWSVDILFTRRGPYITDMALAKDSFHWDDCPLRTGDPHGA